MSPARKRPGTLSASGFAALIVWSQGSNGVVCTVELLAESLDGVRAWALGVGRVGVLEGSPSSSGVVGE